MRKRFFDPKLSPLPFALCSVALSALLFVLCLPAEAQQPGKIPRLGLLTSASTARRQLGLTHSGRVCASWAMSKEKT